MRFFGLIGHNIAARPLRATLTAAAVAIGVMAVTALGVLTASLKETATQILQVGNADFTIAQKNTDDIVNSTIDEADIAAIGQVPGVGSVVGALIDLDRVRRRQPRSHRGRARGRCPEAVRCRHPRGPVVRAGVHGRGDARLRLRPEGRQEGR